jgi:hypothetical protein
MFGSIAYVVLTHTGAGLWYLPLAREWALGPKPAALAMAWFGRTLAVLLLAALGAFVGSRAARRRVPTALAVVAAASLLVAVGTCITENVARPTKPLPLPTGQPVVCDPSL